VAIARPPDYWTDVPDDWQPGDPVPPGAVETDAAGLNGSMDVVYDWVEAYVADALAGLGLSMIHVNRRGVLTVSTGVERHYLPGRFIVIQAVPSLGRAASTSGDVVLDVNYKGTTIFSGAKPTVPANQRRGAAIVPTTVDLNDIAAGYLTMDVDSAGSGAESAHVALIGRLSV
jgi:hypothetical protein